MTDTVVSDARIETRWFYVWIAGICAAVAIITFAPTYWLQLPAGTFTGPPILHVHGALFTAWMLFFVLQTWFVAAGRIRDHRSWGLAGISLATAMVFVGLAAAIAGYREGVAAGFLDGTRAFMISPVSAVLLFGGLIAAAIANTTRPETHKRLMVVATVSLLQPALARVFFAFLVGVGPGLRPGVGEPPPVAITIPPALIGDLLIVAAIIYDWLTRGRPHPAYLIGGGILLAVQLLRVPLSATPGWGAIADFLGSFAL